MKIEVDMIGYEDAYCGGYKERSRRLDYSHDYEVMDVTPQQLKEFLDNGISVKQIKNND